MQEQPKIFIVSGPSGSGKTTLCSKLLTLKTIKGKLIKSLSVTTRPKRATEINKQDYIFVTKKDFLSRKRKNEFLESKTVFGNLYGTPKRFVEKVLNLGGSVLLCIDVKGALSVKKAYPNAVSIFILPPSLKVLKQRLCRRLSEKQKEVASRLNLARQEISCINRYNYTVVNDDLKQSVRQLESVFIAEQCRIVSEKKAKTAKMKNR